MVADQSAIVPVSVCDVPSVYVMVMVPVMMVPTRPHVAYDRAIVVVIILPAATIVPAIIVRARNSNAYPDATGSGVEPDLRHCRRGGATTIGVAGSHNASQLISAPSNCDRATSAAR